MHHKLSTAAEISCFKTKFSWDAEVAFEIPRSFIVSAVIEISTII